MNTQSWMAPPATVPCLIHVLAETRSINRCFVVATRANSNAPVIETRSFKIYCLDAAFVYTPPPLFTTDDGDACFLFAQGN